MRNLRAQAIPLMKLLTGIIVLTALILYLDIAELLNTVLGSNKFLIVLSVPFYLLTRVIKAEIWRRNLSIMDEEVKWMHALKSLFSAGIPAFVLPGVVGTLTRPLYLNKTESQTPMKKGFSAFVLEQLISLTAYSVVVLCSIMFFISAGNLSVVPVLLLIFSMFMAVIGLTLYTVFFGLRISFLSSFQFFEYVEEYRMFLRENLTQYRAIAKVFWLQLSIYVVTVGITAFVLFGALGYRPSLWIPALLPSVAQSLSIIPITPAGLGTIEVSGVYLMTEAGVALNIAGSFFLLHRVIPTLIDIILGIRPGLRLIDEYADENVN